MKNENEKGGGGLCMEHLSKEAAAISDEKLIMYSCKKLCYSGRKPGMKGKEDEHMNIWTHTALANTCIQVLII